MTDYLLDGRLEISNSRVERSIKPFVMGRKNFLFDNTPRGARASAVIYSVIETAKANALAPYRYLLFLMEVSERRQTPRRLDGAVSPVERHGRLPRDAFSRANLTDCAAGRHIFTRYFFLDSL